MWWTRKTGDISRFQVDPRAIHREPFVLPAKILKSEIQAFGKVTFCFAFSVLYHCDLEIHVCDSLFDSFSECELTKTISF